MFQHSKGVVPPSHRLDLDPESGGILLDLDLDPESVGIYFQSGYF